MQYVWIFFLFDVETILNNYVFYIMRFFLIRGIREKKQEIF